MDRPRPERDYHETAAAWKFILEDMSARFCAEHHWNQHDPEELRKARHIILHNHALHHEAQRRLTATFKKNHILEGPESDPKLANTRQSDS